MTRESRTAHSNDHASAGRSRPSSGFFAALPWVALTLVALFWGTTVLGITVALADRGTSAWWVVLLFGALPFVAMYRVASRLMHRPAPPTRSELDLSGPEVLDAGASRPPDSLPADEPVVVEPLTARELEVLVLLDKGRTNGDIARELFVSPATVKSHVNSILRKLGARNRTEAVAHARRLDLIS